MTKVDPEPSVSDTVAANIRSARKRRNWKPADLAAKCKELGFAISENVVENIESGRRDKAGRRRREISVDELVAIAYALGMPPGALAPELRQSFWDLSEDLFDDVDEMVTRFRDLQSFAQKKQFGPRGNAKDGE